MAMGKNKRLTKGSKGSKKKVGDPMAKKEWYDVKVPSYFANRSAGKTLVTKTIGIKIASEGLKGRVLEANLADLNKNEDQSYRKIKLEIQDVQGRNCLTDFYGMDFTRDKLCSMIKKWSSLIEGNVDVKTSDGYTLRVFAIAFTDRRKNQRKSNCYASASHIRQIRKVMVDVITQECSKISLKDVVKKFLPELVSERIKDNTKGIFPLRDVFIRKVKIVKKPAVDYTRLMDLYADMGENLDAGQIIPESEEAKNTIDA